MIDDVLTIIDRIYFLARAVKEISDGLKVNSAQRNRLIGRIDRLSEAVKDLERKPEEERERYRSGLEGLAACLEEAVEFITTFTKKKWYQRALRLQEDESRFQKLNADLSVASGDLQLALLTKAEMRAEDRADRSVDRRLLQAQQSEIVELNKRDLAVNSPSEQALFQKMEQLSRQREASLLRQIDRWKRAMSREIESIGSPVVSGKKTPEVLHSIDYYELTFERVLAEGLVGQVFQGSWQEHPVAIKALGESNYFTANDRTLLEREMLRMQSLNCPQLVRFYGGCVEEDHVCLVMEYMSGGDLRQYLGSHPSMKLSDKKKIALDIAQGLSYLHQRDILHRDLTSHHVMLDDAGCAKLIDFQSASSLGTHRSLQSVNVEQASSIPWRAPECLSPSGRPSHLSDVYSFGIVLWELLTGELPYVGVSDACVFEQVTQGSQLPIPDAIPKDYANIMKACWAQNPKDRPAMLEVLERLKEAVTEIALYSQAEQLEKQGAYAQAFSHYHQAAYGGHIKAWTKLGDFAYQGFAPFEEVDKKEAYAYYILGSEKGHVRAMLLLAEMLSFGDGVPEEQARAKTLYEEILQSNDATEEFKVRAERRIRRLSSVSVSASAEGLFAPSSAPESKEEMDLSTPRSCCVIS